MVQSVHSDNIRTHAYVEYAYNLNHSRRHQLDRYGDFGILSLEKQYVASPRNFEYIFARFFRLVLNAVGGGIHCLRSRLVIIEQVLLRF